MPPVQDVAVDEPDLEPDWMHEHGEEDDLTGQQPQKEVWMIMEYCNR